MRNQIRLDMDGTVLDELIARLLEGRRNRAGRRVQMTEAEIKQLCLVSKEIFLQQPILLELEAPVNVCGTFSFNVFICVMFISASKIEFREKRLISMNEHM